jgi:hypothetical protein
LNPNWRANVLGEPYFDVTSFAAPAFGKFGSLGRNVFIGPGAVTADLSILKDFPIREGHRLPRNPLRVLGPDGNIYKMRRVP